MKTIIDYVISFEDGMYLIMQLYENREWDTYATTSDPSEAIRLMHEALRTIKS